MGFYERLPKTSRSRPHRLPRSRLARLRRSRHQRALPRRPLGVRRAGHTRYRPGCAALARQRIAGSRRVTAGSPSMPSRGQHGRQSRMRRLRWTSFMLVVLAYALSFFHRMAPATIAADLQQTFAASAALLGGISATYFYIYTLMQIPTGVLADTLGPRRILTLGGIIAGAGSLMFGLAE